MIAGVGIDLCPVARIDALLGKYEGRFERKVFTARERAYCRARAHPGEHFAARFAAKEALLKALGVPQGLSWHDMEIDSTGGRPELRLTGAAATVAARLGVTREHLSLTHAGGLAAAVVVLEA